MHVEPVLLFMGGMLILGGAANVFFPREALELDRLVVPKKSFLVLEKAGIVRTKGSPDRGIYRGLAGNSFCVFVVFPSVNDARCGFGPRFRSADPPM